MSIRRIKSCLAALLIASSLAGVPAWADTLLMKNVMVTTPTAPSVESFVLNSAGTLTVTVSDLAWPDLLAGLSFAISDTRGVLTSLVGPGSLTYVASGPMALFSNVYATPNPTSGSGLYHIDVSFAPAVVPLPGALALFVSGLFGLRRLMQSASRARDFVTGSVAH